MSATQQRFIVEPKVHHTHTIILLHGRGSTGEEFARDWFECEVTDSKDAKSCTTLQERFPSCRWIFPTARSRYSTVFQEEIIEWFDVYSLTDPDERHDLQRLGLVESLNSIMDLVRDETERIDTNKLIIGGISQGFATAATFIIAYNFKCSGFIGLSGWLPFASHLQKVVIDGNGQLISGAAQRATAFVKQILNLYTEHEDSFVTTNNWTQNPIFIGHERHDTVVAIELGEAARDVFRMCGANTSWHSYDSGDHWIQEPDEISDIVRFLDECIGDIGDQS